MIKAFQTAIRELVVRLLTRIVLDDLGQGPTAADEAIVQDEIRKALAAPTP